MPAGGFLLIYYALFFKKGKYIMMRLLYIRSHALVTICVTLLLAIFFAVNVSAAAEPYMLKDIYPGSSNSYPAYLTNINGILYFEASDGTNMREVWKSDGTAAGTVMIAGGYYASDIDGLRYRANFTSVNGTLFFGAGTSNGATSYRLWKSDGTEAGTVMVKDTYGNSFCYPFSLTNFNGALFFSASNSATGDGLWKSDGTEAGTVVVKNIYAGQGNFVNVNGTLYFQGSDGTHAHGNELWKSDGTEAGTVMVKDIYPGSSFSYPSYLSNVNGMLYFRANDGTHGTELWKSDGTEAGTVMVKDIYPGSSYATPSYLTNVNGTLYFEASDGTHGAELWKSDGTEAGTVMVKDIYPGSSNSYPAYLTNVNGTLYFNETDGIHGYELWKSDGTEAGTVMVKDIYPGSSNSFPVYLTNVNGILYFTASDGAYGTELWKSDGTEAGTVMVKDIYPGSSSSSPSDLVNVNGKLYFAANDGIYGIELWVLEDSETIVTLSSFTAVPKSGKVIIQWSTESETDNAGFNIYHAEAENGPYIKINTSLILAKGSSTEGVAYEFTDSDVQNRKTYWYKLEDIDLNGNSSMHGPVSATPRLIYGKK
jgi:ELWxxDGT repeat protein